MVYHVVFFKFNPGVDDEKVEDIMRQTRIQLLKIPVVRTVKCGKKILTECEWPFFLSVELESMEKLAIYRDDPMHIKYIEDVVKHFVSDRLAMDFEMEPGKDVRYS